VALAELPTNNNGKILKRELQEQAASMCPRRLHMQSPRSFAMRRRLLAAGLLGAVAHPFAALAADTWPAKPVRMIVPFPPGGPVDSTARIFGQKLGEMWKVPSSSTTAPARAA
jgi:hypothetical protein